MAADLARSAPRAAAGRLDGDEPLLDALEPRRDLLAELVHRRVEPGRVEEQRELGRVAVEVALEHPADPADRAVALLLVEQLVDHRAQGAAVAEEPLQGPRQASVAVGEVRAQRLLEGRGGPLVDLLRLADHPLEFGPDGVDVDRHARVLEGEQADPQRALDEAGALGCRALAEERGRVGSAGSRRSMTIRSPSSRTRPDGPGPSGSDDGSGR